MLRWRGEIREGGELQAGGHQGRMLGEVDVERWSSEGVFVKV